MNTVLGLLAKGNMNCCGPEIRPDQDIFGTKVASTQETTTTADLHSTPRSAAEIGGTGVVLTAAEKEKAEEERRRREEENERIRKEEEERQLKEEEERRKNSFWNKTLRGIKKFGETIMGPEEE